MHQIGVEAHQQCITLSVIPHLLHSVLKHGQAWHTRARAACTSSHGPLRLLPVRCEHHAMHRPTPLHIIMHALHISLRHATYSCLPSVVQHQVVPKHDVATLPVAGTGVLCMAWHSKLLPHFGPRAVAAACEAAAAMTGCELAAQSAGAAQLAAAPLSAEPASAGFQQAAAPCAAGLPAA
ncbi:hypothetical protein HaLaN_27625 [Haematococcus lacustris]|uniref:Uncharacterized protein n=1 Tax=Haematococcus lacustris TaxID=44745 RepID=A0A6A0A8T7_HAELA|nr:hypothetical protein HaLaN_27625 [Haematococcus lacustris]